MLFHLISAARWSTALAAGTYRPDGDFIHLSLDRQWPLVRERFYRDVADLVLLVIDPARLTSPVVYEAADGDEFPHLYGPLDLDAVIEVRAL
jgi:uncharacterized protein (DUF952 family)